MEGPCEAGTGHGPGSRVVWREMQARPRQLGSVRGGGWGGKAPPRPFTRQSSRLAPPRPLTSTTHPGGGRRRKESDGENRLESNSSRPILDSSWLVHGDFSRLVHGDFSWLVHGDFSWFVHGDSSWLVHGDGEMRFLLRGKVRQGVYFYSEARYVSRERRGHALVKWGTCHDKGGHAVSKAAARQMDSVPCRSGGMPWRRGGMPWRSAMAKLARDFER